MCICRDPNVVPWLAKSVTNSTESPITQVKLHTCEVSALEAAGGHQPLPLCEGGGVGKRVLKREISLESHWKSGRLEEIQTCISKYDYSSFS